MSPDLRRPFIKKEESFYKRTKKGSGKGLLCIGKEKRRKDQIT